MTTEKDYRDALTVQDACNLSGVVFAWAKVMEKICAEASANGYGTEWKNSHPINVLFASKVADLTGCESGEVFSESYAACEAYNPAKES